MNSDAMRNVLKRQAKIWPVILIENQLEFGRSPDRMAGRQTPRGGTRPEVSLPLFPTPFMILAKQELVD